MPPARANAPGWVKLLFRESLHISSVGSSRPRSSPPLAAGGGGEAPSPHRGRRLAASRSTPGTAFLPPPSSTLLYGPPRVASRPHSAPGGGRESVAPRPRVARDRQRPRYSFAPAAWPRRPPPSFPPPSRNVGVAGGAGRRDPGAGEAAQLSAPVGMGG